MDPRQKSEWIYSAADFDFICKGFCSGSRHGLAHFSKDIGIMAIFRLSTKQDILVW